MNKFTSMDAQVIGEKLGVDWNTVSIHELYLGMNAELEHAETLGRSDPETMAEIALDHLDEDPHYYTHLQQIERS